MTDDLNKQIAEWVASPEGKKQLEATLKSARRAAAQVLKDAKVSHEQLQRPVDC